MAVKRGYCTENPCLRLELPKKEDKEPVIANIETVRKLLIAAEASGKLAIKYVAIGLFSGIRSGEIAALDWEQVDFENKTITVLTACAKSRARRIVDMSENLMAWIRPYQKPKGSVLGDDISAARKSVQKSVGWQKWPHNILRHSFASYHYAQHRNEPLLMQLMGHGDDGRILHNHYRALVQPNDAKAFWNIFPSPTA